MTKKEIRTLYKQKRSELTAAERDTMSMQIANQLLQLPYGSTIPTTYFYQ